MTNWISVKDRLPEPGELVIATAGALVCDAYIGAGGRWLRGYGAEWQYVFGKDRPVTYWAKMPEPPKEESDERLADGD